MVIAVIGLGFVGLTTAVGLACLGHRVIGIERDARKREIIQSGRLPFYEPQLECALKEALSDKLVIVEDQQRAIPGCDVLFYCVGTPCAENGEADLRYLKSAVQETVSLARKTDKILTLVTKSTVPIGTMQNVTIPLVRGAGFTPGLDIELVSNPEFLREGHCWEDFMYADRIVIGAQTERARAVMAEVYDRFSSRIEYVSFSTAEFVKYLSNTMLAAMISFSNEMADVAQRAGDIEIGNAFRILHKDRRWAENTMSSYVFPGCGFGGYCLPKDTEAMYRSGIRLGAKMPVLRSVIETNNRMSETICDRLLEGRSSDISVGILGLAFKPMTDDVRDTPAARVISSLQQRGIHSIYAYDPMAEAQFAASYPALPVVFPGSANAVVAECDVIAILTAWPAFRQFAGLEKVLDFRYMT